jgi:hypothetical protein
MKYDITKTALWECYTGVIPFWFNNGGETEVNELLYDLLGSIQEKFNLTDDASVSAMGDLLDPILGKIGVAFIKDIEGIAATGSADSIDKVMDGLDQ